MTPNPNPTIEGALREHRIGLLPQGLMPVQKEPRHAKYMALERRFAFDHAMTILEEQAIEVDSADKSERRFFIKNQQIAHNDEEQVNEARQLNMALSFFWYTKLGEVRDSYDDHGEVLTVMPGRLYGSVLETFEQMCKSGEGAA